MLNYKHFTIDCKNCNKKLAIPYLSNTPWNREKDFVSPESARNWAINRWPWMKDFCSPQCQQIYNSIPDASN